MEEITTLFKNFGGWGVLIAVVLIVGRWLKPWAEKMFAAHLGLVESLKDSQMKMTTAVEAVAEGQKELKEVAVANSRLLAELHKDKLNGSLG